MNLTEERHIRELISAVPRERRLQAQAAVTGPVARLRAQVHAVRAVSSAGWQASVSAHYMTELAALYRPPDQVAEMVRDFHADFGADVVLDAATERPPAQLAAIAAALPEATEFLRRVVLRRRPGDTAAMLTALWSDSDGQVLAIAAGRVCADMPPDKVAQVVVHLRAMDAWEPLDALLTDMPGQAPVTNLGAFLLNLADFGDAESVRATIAGIVTGLDVDRPGADQLAAEAGDKTRDVVDRVAAVVEFLQRNVRADLVNDVETSVIAKFAAAGQQYRLYALAFVYGERGLHDAVERITDKISESATGDYTEMVLKFCDENRQQAGALLPIVLRKPKPAALVSRFAEKLPLDSQRDIIFRTVATWPSQDLIQVDADLSGTSIKLADRFDATVAEIAPQRGDGEEIGAIVLWFLKHRDDKQGMRRANHVVAEVVTRRQPELLADLIRTLRDGKGWWLGPRGKMVRDEAAHRVSEHYDIADMTALVTEAMSRRCVPAVLRLAPDWLTRSPRSDGQIVQLLRALKAAGCEPTELADMVRWVAFRFNRPDGSDPFTALKNAEKAELEVKREKWRRAGWTQADVREAERREQENALWPVWLGVKRSVVPRFPRRPPHDPPQR